MLTNLLILAATCMVYALADYIGYNRTRHDPRMLKRYRIAQVVMQIVLTIAVWYVTTPRTALGFNVIWWTFGADILYYGYAAILNPGGRWESRGNFRKYVLGNQCTWAFWTPVGMLRGMDRRKRIAGSTLMVQAAIGLLVGIALTIFL